MGENSKIEWTTHTFNPWIGCQKVSAGCDHCYAETLMDTRLGRVQWGPHGERMRTSVANWRKPLQWAKQARHFAELHGGRQRVFCASLADWLDNKVPAQWRVDLANLIEATPQLDWLLLTKRIENFDKLAPWHRDSIPDNVWLGVTCEDQDAYNRRWAILSQIPAAVRFISYEPALGPLWLPAGWMRPDWIICGGESGNAARPMHPQWARSLCDQCESYGIPFLFKQWGEWASAKGYPGHIPIGHVFDDGYQMIRAGKKAAGRLLDSVEHNGMPAGFLCSSAALTEGEVA